MSADPAAELVFPTRHFKAWREFRGLPPGRVERLYEWPSGRIANLEAARASIAGHVLLAPARAYRCSVADLGGQNQQGAGGAANDQGRTMGQRQPVDDYDVRVWFDEVVDTWDKHVRRLEPTFGRHSGADIRRMLMQSVGGDLIALGEEAPEVEEPPSRE